MMKPKPKFGWHGTVTESVPNKALVHWKGIVPTRDILSEMRSTGVRTLQKIIQLKPDASRVPDEHCGIFG